MFLYLFHIQKNKKTPIYVMPFPSKKEALIFLLIVVLTIMLGLIPEATGGLLNEWG